MAPLIAPIRFIPILKQNCVCLGLPEPIYNRLDVAENVGYVLVSKGSQANAFSFKGDRGITIQDSFESAARKMVVCLVKKYKIVVLDINLELRWNIEQGIQLFKMKKDDFEAMEKEIPLFRSTSLSAIEGVDNGSCTIEIDFLNMLTSVISMTQTKVTPIEVICLDQVHYKAWFMVENLGKVTDSVCLIRDVCFSTAAAKQSLAKKTILELISVYQLEIRDVNYYLLEVSCLALKYERENYIVMKERVHGLTEEKNPQALIVEQDQLTPRGEKNMISVTNKPPLPTRKRKLACRTKSFGATIPKTLIPAELDTVFKRRKEG